MDWLTFIVQMTRVLSWPLVVLGVLLLFRRALSTLPRRLLSLRFRDFEFAFASTAAEVAENIASSKKAELGVTPEDEKLFALAERSPRGVIIEVWVQVEAELRKLAGRHEIEEERIALGRLVRELETREVIDSKTAQSIHGLMTLRNLAVHAPETELTPKKAVEFIMLAKAVLFILTTKA